MTITGDNLAKKFGSHWIFKGLSFGINQGDSVAIVGPNGSGKSTLLQIICSALTPSKGTIKYSKDGENISCETAIQKINFSGPYMELIEEFTLAEHLTFQGKFKERQESNEWIADQVGLANALKKPISQFSSGMKQRTRLALQLYFNADVLALDEPTSNLDDQGKKIYLDTIREQIGQKTILISSNDRSEYDFCEKIIDLRIS